MWLDKENLVSNDQSFAGADELGADLSTNAIDLAGVAKDMGKGSPIPFFIQITETFVGDVASIVATIQTATDEAFSSPVTAMAVTLTSKVAGAAGAYWFGTLPAVGLNRYLRISYQANDAVTSGKLTAGVAINFQNGFGH